MNEFIKQEVSKAISKVTEPEMGLITVLAVETQKDMKKSYVWLSILAHDKEAAFEKLRQKTQEIQEVINERSSFRNTPKIELKYDSSEGYVSKIEGILKKIREDDSKK
ncbi:ribosome-binding factor A [Patescibacteria group bacterium]|nr:ribosome-binding factor A [Patescibacteria group bacterium]